MWLARLGHQDGGDLRLVAGREPWRWRFLTHRRVLGGRKEVEDANKEAPDVEPVIGDEEDNAPPTLSIDRVLGVVAEA